MIDVPDAGNSLPDFLSMGIDRTQNSANKSLIDKDEDFLPSPILDNVIEVTEDYAEESSNLAESTVYIAPRTNEHNSANSDSDHSANAYRARHRARYLRDTRCQHYRLHLSAALDT